MSTQSFQINHTDGRAPSLADAELFLLDMDGTFYLDNRLLPGAQDFLRICKDLGVRYTFVTNNSSKSPQAYIEKLEHMGVYISSAEILTSGDATLMWMEDQGLGRDILLIGTESLEAQFAERGYHLDAPSPCLVVLGFDTSLTYQKLTALCDAVRSGIPYIATHADLNCPTADGYIPDIGATIAFVEASTGRRPDVILGKPNGLIAQAAARRADVPLERLCMVGDRLYTDIALGQCGVLTALVLTGESTLEDLRDSPYRPDFVFQGLLEMGEALRQLP